jgi:acyl-CoA synthetase (AMP-forming)/AMP-acid ligase II
VYTPLAAGSELFLMERFDPAAAVELISAEKLTITITVATILQRINELPYDRDLSSLNRNLVGGSTQPSSVREEFEARFNCPIFHGYGSSELIGTVLHHPLDQEELRRRKLPTLGLPTKGVEASLVDDDNNPVADGDWGELCFRDDGSGYAWKPMLGYHNRPEESARSLPGDGWFHSNDLAVRDEDGWFTVKGRRGDLIKVSSWSVFASEIETVLKTDERVRDVAVAGVADERTGQKPVAFVTLREGAELQPGELVELVGRRLAKFKGLRETIVMEELPVNAYGKVLKHRLVADYEGGSPAA